MSRTVNLGKIVPERGTDYWTAQDKAEIISTATTNVENNFASTIATIQSNSSNALNTANTANNTANTAKSIAEGANQALSYTNYQAMITAFNELADNVYKVGQNIMIITLNVPDLWISAIENTSITYNYTNDEAITTALSTNGYIQVGYYKLSALETQKVDLTDYYTKTGTENKIEDYLYQIMPTDSASGTIATINDATTMFNAIDVSGTIKPVQDLHGYDYPWPAGGGKNLLPQKKYQYTSTQVRLGGETAQEAYITLKAGTYTLSVTVNVTAYAYYIQIGGSPIQIGAFGGTFTLEEDTQLVVYLYRSGGLNIDDVTKWQLETGSTATSWTPYSNICPITGWTGCDVKHSGADTSNPTTYSIAFPTEAGTIYGGSLDVTTGLLTVDRAIKNVQISLGVYNSTINTLLIYSSNGIFSDALAPANNNIPFSAIAESTNINSASAINAGGYGIGLSTTKDVYLRAVGASSKDDYLSIFPNGINVVYELATPITYQLTPQEVSFLLGTNNLWVDTGDINVTYKADIQKYIDKKTN